MVDKLGLVRHALLRLQRAEPATRLDARGSTVGAQGDATSAAEARAARDAAFERRVRQRVAQVDADDPQRRRRALRVIVETTLLQEFGERLNSDPAFHEMVDQVVQTMAEDALLAAQIDVALNDLLP